MHGIVYLVGLIVVEMALLSLLGVRRQWPQSARHRCEAEVEPSTCIRPEVVILHLFRFRQSKQSAVAAAVVLDNGKSAPSNLRTTRAARAASDTAEDLKTWRLLKRQATQMACLDDGIYLDAFAFNRRKITGTARPAISFVSAVAALYS
jgi:hypothetical protein